MIFTPAIINNTLPEVSVTVADSGNPPVTYNQIKNSLGNQVYNIDSFYLFSTVANQLIGVIKYNRYDATGNQEITNIATTVDPYQYVNAINVDLTQYPIGIILNGNSSLSSVILPNAYLQLKLYCRRITNGFDINGSNFRELEQIFRPKFFETFDGFEADGKLIILNPPEEEEQNEKVPLKNIMIEDDRTSLAVLSFAAFSFGFYLLVKE